MTTSRTLDFEPLFKTCHNIQRPVDQEDLEVLALVANGKTNSEVGQALFIGEAPVKTHLLHAFAKLDVDDRIAAVTSAIAPGLLPSPGGRSRASHQ